MADSGHYLCVRAHGATEQIHLYTSTADVEPRHICARVGGVTLYASLSAAGYVEGLTSSLHAEVLGAEKIIPLQGLGFSGVYWGLYSATDIGNYATVTVRPVCNYCHLKGSGEYYNLYVMVNAPNGADITIDGSTFTVSGSRYDGYFRLSTGNHTVSVYNRTVGGCSVLIGSASGTVW